MTKIKDDSIGFSCGQGYEGAEEYKILRADKNGRYNILDEDGDLLFIADINEKLYDGLFEKYWKGHLEIRGRFSKGKRIGKWYYFTDQDKINAKNEYRQDTIIEKYFERDIDQEISCTTTEIKLQQNDSEETTISKKRECVSQRNLEHIATIKKLGGILKNKWTLEPGFTNDKFGENELSFSLFTKVTEDKKGNLGVGLVFIDKKYKQHILKRDPNENFFFETKSCIVYVNYQAGWRPDLIKTLKTDLETFFETNKEKL